MLPTDDRIVKVILASVPIGLDRNLYDTLNVVFNKFMDNPENQWVIDHAQSIDKQIENASHEMGVRVVIFGMFTLDDAILLKLYKTYD